jgi:hypothetical protein
MWSALALAQRQDNLSLLRAAVHPTSLIGTWGQTHQSRALLFNLAAAPRLRRPLIISFYRESARSRCTLAFVGSRRARARERAQAKCPIIAREICTWEVRESRFQIKCLLLGFFLTSIASAPGNGYSLTQPDSIGRQ